MIRGPRILWTALLSGAMVGPSLGHDGPPYPIVSDATAGAYRVSIWTDPDTTDDETPGGQFWIIVDPLAGGPLEAPPRVSLAVKSLDEPRLQRQTDAGRTEDPSRFFAAVRLEREGRWAVAVTIDSPSGPAAVSSEVDATYDLRPAPVLLALYLLPFVLVGLLWFEALRRGRRGMTRKKSADALRRVGTQGKGGGTACD